MLTLFLTDLSGHLARVLVRKTIVGLGSVLNIRAYFIVGKATQNAYA